VDGTSVQSAKGEEKSVRLSGGFALARASSSPNLRPPRKGESERRERERRRLSNLSPIEFSERKRSWLASNAAGKKSKKKRTEGFNQKCILLSLSSTLPGGPVFPTNALSANFSRAKVGRRLRRLAGPSHSSRSLTGRAPWSAAGRTCGSWGEATGAPQKSCERMAAREAWPATSGLRATAGKSSCTKSPSKLWA